MNLLPHSFLLLRPRHMSCLSLAFRATAVLAMLLFTATHLPAPIFEKQEPSPDAAASPTPKTKPSHDQPAKSSASPKPKPKENVVSVEKQAQPRALSKSAQFSGKWRGVLSGALLADTDITVVIDEEVSSAVVKGIHDMWGDRPGKIRIKGNTLFWNFLAEHWIMTVAPDGKSATIVGQHWPVGTTSGTLKR